MNSIIIKQQPIELYKLLKIESLVYGGGEAKIIIAEGLIKLNGQVETQKRKKILAGDIIEFDGESYLVELDPQTEIDQSTIDEVERLKQLRLSEKTQPMQTPSVTKRPKRKPIQF